MWVVLSNDAHLEFLSVDETLPNLEKYNFVFREGEFSTILQKFCYKGSLQQSSGQV